MSEYKLSTLRRGIDILETLAAVSLDQGSGMRASRLARTLDETPSQISRALAVLLDAKFVQRDGETGTYRLGWRLYAMITKSTVHELIIRSDRELIALANDVGEKAHITALEGTHAVTLNSMYPDGLQAEPRDSQGGHALETEHAPRDWVGRALPACCTSSGHALMSDLTPEQLVERFGRRAWSSGCPHRNKSLRALNDQLAAARRNGVAISEGVIGAGYATAAAPIRTRNGKVISAIGVAGPSERLAPRLAEVGVKVKTVAARIQQNLGTALDVV